MKRIYSTLLLAFLCYQLQGQFDRQQTLHFVGGGLFGLAGAGIAKKVSKGDRWWTFAGAVGGSAFIGVGKEAIDINGSPFGWNNTDLFYTVLGGATAGLTLDLATDHGKKRQKKRLQQLKDQQKTTAQLEKEAWMLVLSSK